MARVTEAKGKQTEHLELIKCLHKQSYSCDSIMLILDLSKLKYCITVNNN